MINRTEFVAAPSIAPPPEVDADRNLDAGDFDWPEEAESDSPMAVVVPASGAINSDRLELDEAGMKHASCTHSLSTFIDSCTN